MFIAAVLCGFSLTARAQATRTWVSGVGDDANPCSRTAPCKTFAGAISKTAAGGEINVLDPGGFGAVTITKSITIRSDHFEAGVLVSGTNGIIVSAGASDKVVLEGLDIEGLGTGLNGIRFLSGQSLTIRNCKVQNFVNSGVDFEPNSGVGQLHVERTAIIKTANSTSDSAVLVRPQSGAGANAEVDHCNIVGNANGVYADATSATAGINLNVRDSSITHSSNVGVAAGSSGNYLQVTVDRTEVLFSQNIGLGANGAPATIRVGGSTIAHNATGVAALNGGTVQSFKNNQIASNGADGTPITAVPGGLQ